MLKIIQMIVFLGVIICYKLITMYNYNFKKNFIITSFCLSLAFSPLAYSQEINSTPLKNSYNNEKIYSLEKKLLQDKSQDTIKEYIKAQKKLARQLRVFKKDYIEATDCLRSALYFAKKYNFSKEYQTLLEQLNETVKKSGFEYDNYNRLEIAKNLYLEGKYYASAYEFEELYAKNVEREVCLEYLGDIEQKTNTFKDSALNYYKKALEINPNNVSCLFKIAKLYTQTNRNSLALEYYLKVINLSDDEQILKQCVIPLTIATKRSPRSANLYEAQGIISEKTGDYKKAYELYQRAIFLNPKDVFLKYRLGGFLYDTKQYPRAIRVYDNILRDNMYESQIRAGKAKSLLAMGQTQEALKEYQVILAIYPDSKQAKYGVYETLKNKGDIDLVINNLYPLNENFVADAEFLYDFAELLISFDQTQGAIELYKKTILKDPKNEKAYLKLYEIYELEGKNLEAQKLILEAYKHIPQNEEIKKIYLNQAKNVDTKKDELALNYLKSNQWTKAIKIYEQIEPKNADIHIAIANCYRYLKNYKMAAENYKKAISLDNTNSDTYYSLALTYLDQNSPQLAQSMLLKSVELNPKNVKAIKLSNYLKNQNTTNLLNEAYTYYDKKDYKNALKKIETAMKLYPDDPQAYYYRGIILEAMEMYPEAIKSYRMSVKLNRSFSLGYYSLAKVCEKYGRFRDALEAYEKYLSVDPKEEELIKEAEKKVIELGEKYY